MSRRRDSAHKWQTKWNVKWIYLWCYYGSLNFITIIAITLNNYRNCARFRKTTHFAKLCHVVLKLITVICQKTYYFLSVNYKSISNTLHAFYHDNLMYQSSLWLSHIRNKHWGKYPKCYHNRISINTDDVAVVVVEVLLTIRSHFDSYVGYNRNFLFSKISS